MLSDCGGETVITVSINIARKKVDVFKGFPIALPSNIELNFRRTSAYPPWVFPSFGNRTGAVATTTTATAPYWSTFAEFKLGTAVTASVWTHGKISVQSATATDSTTMTTTTLPRTVYFKLKVGQCKLTSF